MITFLHYEIQSKDMILFLFLIIVVSIVQLWLDDFVKSKFQNLLFWILPTMSTQEPLSWLRWAVQWVFDETGRELRNCNRSVLERAAVDPPRFRPKVPLHMIWD